MIDKNYMPLNITVPQAKKVLVRRNICKIINEASLDEIVYLVAPYGSGKTMAVLSWLKESQKKAAWATLTEGVNSPESFWAHITAAILIFAGEHEKAYNLLKDSHFIENPRAFLRETLIRVSPAIDEKILVIDSFMIYQNDGLLLEARDVLSNMLGCWRIIVICRYELPPLFNDFILKKHLCLVTRSELNFHPDEIGEYFNLYNRPLNEKELSQIYEDTDGWPAALNAIVSVEHDDVIGFNSIAKAYVMGYFESEIWRLLSESDKMFLMKTSILDKLTPSACHYVANTQDATHILRNLYINGLFVSKLDGMETYCYHRVFREFLLEKLNDSNIDVNSIYISAGWWLYERNESVPALCCFYRAKFLHGINMAFKKVKPAYMGMDNYIKATYCLTSIDVMELKQQPEVAARIALLHFLAGEISKMKQIYAIIRTWLEPGVLRIPPEEYADFYWEIGWLRYVNPDEDVLFSADFEKWVNVKEYAPHMLENDRARASAFRLPSILRGVRDFSVDVDQTLAFYTMNIQTHESIRDDVDLTVTDIIYAEICYEREQFEEAEKTIKRIMPIIEREKHTELCFSCIELMVKITRAVHNTKEIDGLVEHLKTQIESNGHTFLRPNFHAFELRNRLANGITGVSEQFEREHKAYRDKMYYYLIYRHFTYIRALISEGKYNEATIMLGNFSLLLCQYKRTMDLIEMNILYSVTEYGLGHEADACRYLKLALDSGRKRGFIRIFSDDAVLLWPVLSLFHKHEIDDYIKKIIVSCKKTLAHSGISNQIIDKIYDPLTKAEIGILELLPSAMTYDEIAEEKGIKISTVRAHIHAIYSKLDVKNRHAATVVAEKLGLIKTR